MPEQESTPKQPRQYKAYLLRLWREGKVGRWRLSLQSPTQETVFYFSSLDEMILFLVEQMDGSSEESR